VPIADFEDAFHWSPFYNIRFTSPKNPCLQQLYYHRRSLRDIVDEVPLKMVGEEILLDFFANQEESAALKTSKTSLNTGFIKKWVHRENSLITVFLIP
jgi:hypothetical protein